MHNVIPIYLHPRLFILYLRRSVLPVFPNAHAHRSEEHTSELQSHS